jgi:DNA invertase Pin-like site-specific DNA recombinase
LVPNPTANRLTLHILAAVAQHEREMISERTKAALAAVKGRGRVLGSHGRKLADANRKSATERLAPIADRLLALKASGQSVRGIAATLNAEGVPSPAGGRWHIASVHRALGRLAARSAS